MARTALEKRTCDRCGDEDIIGAADPDGDDLVGGGDPRRVNWAREWENCSDAPLAWLAAVDRDCFRRTYTGSETLHSYMALRYLAATIGKRSLVQLGIRGVG